MASFHDPASTTQFVIHNAFVLGAGLGTRLRSLTARRPKPLIPVANRPLITYAFDHLLGAGVERFAVNTHWRAEAYAASFPEQSHRGAPLTFCHEHPAILETAGGIWNARDLLSGAPFIVYNGDILTDLPLEPALRAHFQNGNEVTLVLRSQDGPLQVAFDAPSTRITDIAGHIDPAAGPRYLFTGIYIVDPAFISRIPAATKISVIPIFCEMIRAGARLGGVVIDRGTWRDLGTRESYLDAHAALALASEGRRQESEWIHPTAEISGATAIGPGVRIGAKARLHDCILWEGAEIASESLLKRCIVTDGQRVSGAHTDADF